MSSISSESSHRSDGPAPRKKRVRHWTSSDRARHRVIEKERREAFNESLLKLASLLPALDGCKQSQLSKHVIVHESVKQHNAQKDAAEATKRQLVAMTAERDMWLNEVKQWRMLSGVEPLPPGTHSGGITGQGEGPNANGAIDASLTAAQTLLSVQYPAYEAQGALDTKNAVQSFYQTEPFAAQQPRMHMAVPEPAADRTPTTPYGSDGDILRPGPYSNEMSQMNYYLHPSMEQY